MPSSDDNHIKVSVHIAPCREQYHARHARTRDGQRLLMNSAAILFLIIDKDIFRFQDLTSMCFHLKTPNRVDVTKRVQKRYAAVRLETIALTKAPLNKVVELNALNDNPRSEEHTSEL